MAPHTSSTFLFRLGLSLVLSCGWIPDYMPQSVVAEWKRKSPETWPLKHLRWLNGNVKGAYHGFLSTCSGTILQSCDVM